MLALGLLALPPPDGLAVAGWRTAAVAVLMAVWWATEALPLAATALVPLVAFPLLGISAPTALAGAYGDPLIFLFLGGFLLALAIQRAGLHRRLALAVTAAAGTGPRALIGGFMVATAFLSMWVSNTATAVLMLPIAQAVILVVERAVPERAAAGFAKALLLAIAYAASIGGIATLIGTPPNALLASFLRQSHGIELGFADWLAVGLPLALILLGATWLLLTRALFPLPAGTLAPIATALARERRAHGPMHPAERRVALVFAATALAWLARPWLAPHLPGLDDTVIAVLAGLALFVLPAGTGPGERLLDWRSARELPWGVLLLFGGGLALAQAIAGSGLGDWLGRELTVLDGLPPLLVVLLVTALVVFVTELTSNTATAATFLPLATALAAALGVEPWLLAMPVAVAASCAFMMPVATPPNAIVYASGHLRIADMARAGLVLNLVAIVVISAIATLSTGG